MTDIIEQITTTSLSSVNIMLVIVLLGIGWVLKHLVSDLKNSLIPVVLMIIGVVLTILLALPFNPQEELLQLLVSGIASGFVASMVHEKGKGIVDALKDTDDHVDTEE